jgi:tetratricopeptide (TPR) repeat protein
MAIEDLIIDLSSDPFNHEKNFAVALEYQRLNQTASAVSFYLRTAEYGPEKESPHVYAALLKMARCFNDQHDRKHTVTNCLLQAIAYWPERPEAYFYLSQFHERDSNWQEAYTFAEIGLHLADFETLPGDLDYYGKYCLEFEKAVSAYWVGRRDESTMLFIHLKTKELAPEYVSSVEGNLRNINVTF